MSPRLVSNGLFASVIVVALLVFARQIFMPDEGATFFARAQKLEAAGQIPLALQHYKLVSDQHPESVFAPRALLREGDLLAAQGRQNNQTDALRQAVGAYARLAHDYPSDPLANEALLDAGQISSESLHDAAGARKFYDLLLTTNSSSSDAAATATLKLGRLALDGGNGKVAQALLQRVLQRWPHNTLVGAEAQFHLGVVYETLLKNSDWATRAYDATIARYPATIWANNAKERLGLLVFSASQGVRPARRVLIDVEPMPDDNGLDDTSPDSPWSALRPLLASRGLAVSDLTIHGWSLLPFWAALDTNNPARAVTPSFDAFQNVVANAGMRFTVKGGRKPSDALSDLQDDIDAGHLPVVYFAENGDGHWTLCVGYDSQRGEVLLQNQGARFDTLTAKAFAADWKAQSSFGQPYTLLSFISTDAKQNPTPNLTPTPLPSPRPGQTPAPVLNAPPAFVVHLPKLSRADAHARTLERAGTLLERNGNGEILLGATALDWLANELEAATRAPKSTENPVAPLARESNQQDIVTPTATAEGGDTALETPTPTEAPTVAPTAAPDTAASAQRARQLLGFLGAPARQWITLRRQAGSYCEQAANQTNDADALKAGQALTQSATALEDATREVPKLGEKLSPGDREAIATIIRHLRSARDAERQAAHLLG